MIATLTVLIVPSRHARVYTWPHRHLLFWHFALFQSSAGCHCQPRPCLLPFRCWKQKRQDKRCLFPACILTRAVASRTCTRGISLSAGALCFQVDGGQVGSCVRFLVPC
jgi:hypothetical protein